LHSMPSRIALLPRSRRARSRSPRQAFRKPGPEAIGSPLTASSAISPGSLMSWYQSLRRSTRAGAPPASLWNPADAVPQRKSFGNGRAAEAGAASTSAAAAARTTIATRFIAARLSRPDQQVAGHRRLPLDLDRAAAAQHEPLTQTLVGRLGHLDRAGHGMRLHP